MRVALQINLLDQVAGVKRQIKCKVASETRRRRNGSLRTEGEEEDEEACRLGPHWHLTC